MFNFSSKGKTRKIDQKVNQAAIFDKQILLQNKYQILNLKQFFFRYFPHNNPTPQRLFAPFQYFADVGFLINPKCLSLFINFSR